MADLTITATLVLPGTTPPPAYNGKFLAGETITAGEPVYFDTVSKRYFKAINTLALNVDGLPTYTVVGVSLSGGAVSQPIHIQSGGQMFIGATVVATTEYYLSANAGGICPAADIASGHRAVRIGYADSTGSLVLAIQDLGTK